MNKRLRLAVLTLFTIALASLALAHEGHKHKVLGTVKMVHENHLMLSLKDGGEKTVVLTEKTQILKGEEKADRSALEEGVRVSVEVDNDDNALTIKVAVEEHHKGH
jgi:hypothetical protein